MKRSFSRQYDYQWHPWWNLQQSKLVVITSTNVPKLYQWEHRKVEWRTKTAEQSQTRSIPCPNADSSSENARPATLSGISAEDSHLPSRLATSSSVKYWNFFSLHRANFPRPAQCRSRRKNGSTCSFPWLCRSWSSQSRLIAARQVCSRTSTSRISLQIVLIKAQSNVNFARIFTFNSIDPPKPPNGPTEPKRGRKL